MLDCLVLTLPRTPHRLDAFIAQNRQVGFEVQVCQAIDGQDLPREELVAAGLIDANMTWPVGAIGNALSHRSIWKQCIAKQQPLIALEDDCIIAPHAQETLAALLRHVDDWDIVLLGYNTNSAVDLKLSASIDFLGHFSAKHPDESAIATTLEEARSSRLFRLNNAFGMCGYVISPVGAARMLQACFPLRDETVLIPSLRRGVISTSLDGLANGFYRNLNAYACFPPLALSTNDLSQSTVGAGHKS